MFSYYHTDPLKGRPQPGKKVQGKTEEDVKNKINIKKLMRKSCKKYILGMFAHIKEFKSSSSRFVNTPIRETSPYKSDPKFLPYTCNYVVFVWRGFLFLCMLGIGSVIFCGTP